MMHRLIIRRSKKIMLQRAYVRAIHSSISSIILRLMPASNLTPMKKKEIVVEEHIVTRKLCTSGVHYWVAEWEAEFTSAIPTSCTDAQDCSYQPPSSAIHAPARVASAYIHLLHLSQHYASLSINFLLDLDDAFFTDAID